MRNQRLFKVGVNLVKFAWAIEIVAVLIGFLISIIVSYSVYFEINRGEGALRFNDYAAILVAGLPFLLVAIVEATKIPIATAMMYAKHKSWKIMLFIGVIMLTLITFETMINGFERNFANLTFAIDERKDKSLLIQKSIDNIQEQKEKIDIVDIPSVEEAYARKVALANENFNTQVQRHNEYIQMQLSGTDESYKAKIDAELNGLYIKEAAVYEAWDQERAVLQRRLRNLLNQNIEGATTDKQSLAQEIKALKAEMQVKMEDANFLTRPGVEKKYRQLISEKEKRLYTVSDFATGSKALDQQTATEKQLQDHLQLVGRNYQKRIDAIRSRIDYLNKQLKSQQNSHAFLREKYRSELEDFTQHALKNKANTIKRAASEKNKLYNTYEVIQAKVTVLDAEIYELKKQQTAVHHDMNKMVNQNQIYRAAAYISDAEDAMTVSHSLVGLVALVWFASLAFISSITGVFLAIAGIYIQKCYDPDLEDVQQG
jgi:uncharacterized protein YdcH (DUF465 family)